MPLAAAPSPRSGATICPRFANEAFWSGLLGCDQSARCRVSAEAFHLVGGEHSISRVTAVAWGRQMAIEQEAIWLRPRVIQMRALLRRVKDTRVEAVLREFIADAEARLESLDQQARDRRTPCPSP